MLLTQNQYKLTLVLLSLAGLFSLVLLENVFEPIKKIAIKDINKSLVSKKVELSGQVQNAFVKKNTLFFELSNNGTIKAVKFDPTKTDLEIVRTGEFVNALGTIQEYQTELEIVIEEVTPID